MHPDDVALPSFPPWPKIVYNPFGQEVPSNWYPLVTHSKFELIPINLEKNGISLGGRGILP